MAFEFIKNELTEARLLRNEQNLPKTADTLINSLYLHILTLEILRHENPGLAKNYAKRTLQYQTFDKIRTSATDLHNQLAVLTNKDLYHDKIKIPAESNIPLLQTKQYFKHLANERYDNGFSRQYLYKLQRFLGPVDAQLIAARRAVQDWPGLDENERKGAIALLKRQYLLHSRRSDLFGDFEKLARDSGAKKDSIGLAKKAAIAFGAGYALGKVWK